jgi:hypothetical protein
MTNEEIITWVCECLGYGVSDEDALDMYNIYRSYRDEGQSHVVSKQYAGLL